MKKHNNRLDFSKSTIIELNEEQSMEVEGGTAWWCVSAIVVIGVTITVSDEQVISVVHH